MASAPFTPLMWLTRLGQHGAPVATAMTGEGKTWLFIAKALLALYLSCWLAMQLNMPSPSTAMITVLIVMNPQTGMVLAKGFYRFIGTIVGCSAGCALVALFPQQPFLQLLAMSLWTPSHASPTLLPWPSPHCGPA